MRIALAIMFGTALLGCASHEQSQTQQTQLPAYPSNAPDLHVYVGREVHAAGVYSWTNGMRLTDAIRIAGGLTDFATRSRVRITHADGTIGVYDYDRALKHIKQNPLLRPGDKVHVTSPIF